MANMVHIGHVSDFGLKLPRRSGAPLATRETTVGSINGVPVVLKPKPRGRYVLDAQTGAIQFEHDIGPRAAQAMDKVEAALKNLELGLDSMRETVAGLRSPVRQTALVVGGLVAVGLVAGAVSYYFAQRGRRTTKAS